MAGADRSAGGAGVLVSAVVVLCYADARCGSVEISDDHAHRIRVVTGVMDDGNYLAVLLGTWTFTVWKGDLIGLCPNHAEMFMTVLSHGSIQAPHVGGFPQ